MGLDIQIRSMRKKQTAEEANCREMKKIEATLEERDVYFSGTSYSVMVSAG